MASIYQQFLNAPNAALLADDATLHYVTTTTTFTGSADITKHLNALQKQVKKKQQDVINAVVADTSAVFEVDTALEFITSGGVYLPNLDDNFVSDRTVYLSIAHFVHFDADGKILQIRLLWDQGALLKQIDVIGKSGRNWPIRDSKEQLSMVKSALKACGASSGQAASSKNDTRGRAPQSSIDLFNKSREELETAQSNTVASPYAGDKRPSQRSFTDILGDNPDGSHAQKFMSPNKAGTRVSSRGFTEILGDEPVEGSEEANRQRNMSPAKAGASKHFQPMRLFNTEQDDTEEEEPQAPAGKAYIRPNPSKYAHFDFADGSDPADGPQKGVSFDERPKSKHDSQWSFDDFVTPSKHKPGRTLRAQEVRHWDTTDTDDASIHPAGKGRRDAETHFDLQDDDDDVPEQAGRPRGAGHNEGLGLYKNQLFDHNDGTPKPERVLGNITNLKDRGKDFEHHFAMTDESPAHESTTRQPLTAGRQKAVNMMDSNWSAYDESPKQQQQQQAPQQRNDENQGIQIAGDGMGSRKNPTVSNTTGKMGYDKVDLSKNKINTAGDGMGSKKGTNRDWLYGPTTDQEEEEPIQHSRKAPARMRGGNAQSSLWDM